ncbi:NYN domain-containing protein [Nocardioides sp.]|uniref:NYN domain-containing protein n=1 Tax=Nocardioides sp. TaxID=35761 RepID=UPI002ED615C6
MDTDSSAVRIAVLFDADNTSPKYAEAVLEELASYGTPTIKRAYGDFSNQRLAGWSRELNMRAIRAMHQNAFTTGKNSTDSALIIDAMDLLYAGNVEAFAIVSSDSDFTSLAVRLRESGKTVYGLGRRGTPVSLQNACDKFIALEVLGSEPEPAEGGDRAPAESEDDPPVLNLQSALTKAVNATAGDDGWTTLGAIGNHLARSHPSFDPRTFGHTKLGSLVSDQPYLETRPAGTHLEVALKQTRKATKKATVTTTKRATKRPAKKVAKKD